MPRADTWSGALLLVGLTTVSPLAAQEHAVSIELLGEDGGCPAADRLWVALAREGVSVDESAAARVSILRGSGEVVMRVWSDRGTSTRSLVVPDENDDAQCAAVADALAAMLVRSLDGLRWEAPVPVVAIAAAAPSSDEPEAQVAGRALDPPHLPPIEAPTASDSTPLHLSVGLGLALGRWVDRGDVAVGAHLAADLDIDALELGLTAAWLPAGSIAAGPGTLQLTQVPIGVEAGAGGAFGAFRIALRARAELTVISATTQGLSRDGSELGWALHAGATLLASIAPIDELSFGVRGTALGLLSGHTFEVDGLPEPVAAHAPFAASAVLFAALRLNLGAP